MEVFKSPGSSRGCGTSPIDLFEMQVTLTTLCKCLHESGQIPLGHFQTELHKARFDAMLQMYPCPKSTASFQKAMQSENILTNCLAFGGQSLALELFHTCKILAVGLKSNPHMLPGIYVTWSHREMLEWHPIPGLLKLKLAPVIDRSIARDFTLCHSAQTQHLDTLFKCGGGFGGTWRRMTNAALAFYKTAGRWEPLPAMVKKREGHSATVLRGKLYVCGGLNDEFAQESCGEESVHGTMECYDPTTGSWTPLPRMLTRRYNHACTTFQGRLFVCGGISPDKSGGEGQLATVESFQPSERRWTQMPSMLQERSMAPAQAAPFANFALKSVNSRLFAYGGAKTAMIECYQDGFWTEIPTLDLGGCRGCVALTACQGYLYILSRDSAETEAGPAKGATMHRFDPDSGTWQAMPLTVQCSNTGVSQN